jgi:hypothetical protein
MQPTAQLLDVQGERAHAQVPEQGHNVRPSTAAVPLQPDPDSVTLAQAAAANSTKKLRAASTRTHAAGRAAAAVEGTPALTAEVASGVTSAQEGLDLIMGQRIGPFRLTPKQSVHKSGGKHGGWEVFCPFHAKNYKSGCRKWFPILGPALHDKQVAANAALAWCAAAATVNKQCLHLAYPINYDAAPPAAVTRALAIFQTDAPPARPIPDSDMMRSGDAVPKAKARSSKRAEGRAGSSGPATKMQRKGFEFQLFQLSI